MLIQKLSYAFIQLQQALKQREEEDRRKAMEIERMSRDRRRQRGIDLRNIIHQVGHSLFI
jgi:hypothetical protein